MTFTTRELALAYARAASKAYGKTMYVNERAGWPAPAPLRGGLFLPRIDIPAPAGLHHADVRRGNAGLGAESCLRQPPPEP